MNKERHYQFINCDTGNVIAYLSLPADLDEKGQAKQLENKKAEVAISHKLSMELIYWQDQGHHIS
jgi:hypothetical protein